MVVVLVDFISDGCIFFSLFSLSPKDLTKLKHCKLEFDRNNASFFSIAMGIIYNRWFGLIVRVIVLLCCMWPFYLYDCSNKEVTHCSA